MLLLLHDDTIGNLLPVAVCAYAHASRCVLSP